MQDFWAKGYFQGNLKMKFAPKRPAAFNSSENNLRYISTLKYQVF